MKTIICYDLHNVTDSSVYIKIREDIEKAYPKSVYILNTTYIIYSSDEIDSIARKVKSILSKYVHENNFEYFISKISDYRGWLEKSKWNLIDSKLKSSLYS